MREQNRYPGIMVSSNLTDAEFKTLVIEMLNELLGIVENFNKEIKKKNIKMEMEIIKGKQLEMNTLFEIKRKLEGMNRVDEEEDQTINIEDREAKDTQSK